MKLITCNVAFSNDQDYYFPAQPSKGELRGRTVTCLFSLLFLGQYAAVLSAWQTCRASLSLLYLTNCVKINSVSTIVASSYKKANFWLKVRVASARTVIYESFVPKWYFLVKFVQLRDFCVRNVNKRWVTFDNCFSSGDENIRRKCCMQCSCKRWNAKFAIGKRKDAENVISLVL